MQPLASSRRGWGHCIGVLAILHGCLAQGVGPQPAAPASGTSGMLAAPLAADLGALGEPAAGPMAFDSSSNAPQQAPGPFYVKAEGNLAGMDPNAADFKEQDYLGSQKERLRYPDADDFTYNFPEGEGMETVDVGGRSLQIELDNKPALARSAGMSQTYFRLVPCGLNQPHLHPRSSKVVHVLAGTLSMGFVEENSGRVIARNLTVGQSFLFPPGMIMWFHNLDCTEARYLDTWQSADPGITNIATALFRLPPATVAAALGVDMDTAEAFTNRKYSKIALGPPECLQRCNVNGSLSAPHPVQLSTLTSG